jgi:hypothetical protein
MPLTRFITTNHEHAGDSSESAWVADNTAQADIYRNALKALYMDFKEDSLHDGTPLFDITEGVEEGQTVRCAFTEGQVIEMIDDNHAPSSRVKRAIEEVREFCASAEMGDDLSMEVNGATYDMTRIKVGSPVAV